MAVNLVGATTINRVNLYRGQPGTTVATAYTVPAATTVKITSIIICNTTGTAAVVTIAVVPSGGTAAAANQVFTSYSIRPNDTVVFDSPIYMNASDFIATYQGTGSALTVTISGETYA